jgi:hypothetical protein
MVFELDPKTMEKGFLDGFGRLRRKPQRSGPADYKAKERLLIGKKSHRWNMHQYRRNPYRPA